MFAQDSLEKLLVDGYQPEGYWLWDPWVMRVGQDYYLFHLQLPKNYDISANVPRELVKHSKKALDFHSSIGVAKSKDLLNWERVGTALERGSEGEWDDLALWTGCAIEAQGKYYLYYTGRHANEFWTQQIGVAISEDLKTWEKQSGPILSADGHYYGTSKDLNSLGFPPAWRDPFVFWDPQSGLYHMLISARTIDNVEYNACIGHAISEDLLNWELQPPLLEIRGIDQMENPQMQIIDGKYYLFFSTRADALDPDYAQAQKIDAGLYGFVADGLEGQYRPLNETGNIIGQGEQLYSIHLIPRQNGLFAGLGWWQLNENREYACRLAKPLGIRIDEEKAELDIMEFTVAEHQ